MQECTTVLFHRKKTKNNHKNVRETCYWKLIFVICNYSTWARRHAKHARHVGTWGRKARKAWARRHPRHVDTWARKHVRHVSMWPRKHSRHAGTWARKARNLADSVFKCKKYTENIDSEIIQKKIVILM